MNLTPADFALFRRELYTFKQLKAELSPEQVEQSSRLPKSLAKMENFANESGSRIARGTRHERSRKSKVGPMAGTCAVIFGVPIAVSIVNKKMLVSQFYY